MKAGRALFSLVVVIAVLVVACSEDTQPADKGAAVAEPTMAASDPTGADDLPERSRQAAERQQPTLFTGVELLTGEQERRRQELRDARVSWRVEHQEELNEFRRQSAAARKAGDDAAFEAAHDGIRKLRESAPNTRDFLDELTPEQRAQVERNKNLLESSRGPRNESEADRESRIERQKLQLAERRKQRFAGAGLSEDQQRRIGVLGDERRAWHEQNAEQIRALREQQRAARLAGDAAAEQQVDKQIEELRSTAPEIDDIWSELTDEQREKIKQNRPDRNRAAAAAQEGANQAPEDAAADVPGPADPQPSPDA